MAIDQTARDHSLPPRRFNHRSPDQTNSSGAGDLSGGREAPDKSEEFAPICLEPWNGPAQTGRIQWMQQTAGNSAVQRYLSQPNRSGALPADDTDRPLSVQRALGGLIGHGTSVADALKTKEPSDVKDVWLEDFKMASYDERIALIRILAYQGWVGPRDRSKLEEIWGTFSTAQLVSTISKEIILWNQCATVASGLADLPAVTEAAKDFKTDISTKAQYFLGQNRGVVEKEMSKFGLIPTTDPNLEAMLTPAGPTSHQQKQLKEIQHAAQLVARYQTRMQEMSKVLVGKAFQPFDPNAKPVTDFLVGRDAASIYGRDKQDEDPGYTPNNAPTSTQAPNASVNPTVGTRGTWDLVKEQWDFVRGRIASIGNAFPTIFTALNAGTVSIDDLATTDPDKDPQKAGAALRNVQVTMNAAYRNIVKASKNIDDDRTNPLDLRPVYEQLLIGLTVAGGSGRDWKSPFYQWVGRHEVKEHKQVEAYVALALEAAEFAVFVASIVGTGGAATFLAVSAAGVAVPGVKAALSGEKYDVLASANQGQVRGDLAIVDKGDVDLAKMQSEQDAMALKLATMTTFVNGITHGMAEATAIKAAKESGQPPGSPGAKSPNDPPSTTPGDSAKECFVPGTLVYTPDGPQPIETLKAGDLVLAHHVSSGVSAGQRVMHTLVHDVPLVLDIQTGEVLITCSPPHPFWVPGDGWRKAGELEVGMLVQTRDGSTVSISAITARHGSFRVHNIEVEGFHTYFVTELGVLVHNKAGAGRLDGRVPVMRGKARRWREQLAERTGPKAEELRARANKNAEDVDRLDRSYTKAEENNNEPELNRLKDEAKKLERSIDQLEFEATRLGVTDSNVRYYPEEQYLTTGKHGVGWTEGKALAARRTPQAPEGTPLGQFGSASDVDLGVRLAVQNAATLPPQGNVVAIPGRHTMVVHMPDGTTVPARNLYIKIFPETVPGRRLVHMSPRP